MATGDKVLASQYNSWWTSLNNIRTSWDTPGTAVTPTTASQGQIASASTMNSLINQVNALASFYSGADWTNFTESTKAVGEPIKWPNKMVYMLDYLSGVCAFNSTFTNDSTFSVYESNLYERSYEWQEDMMMKKSLMIIVTLPLCLPLPLVIRQFGILFIFIFLFS